MTSVTIQIPDDMAHSLEAIAASRQKTVEQLALEGLASLAQSKPNHPRGTAATLLQVMRDPPHLSDEDVDALEAAIAAGRQPAKNGDIFAD